MTTFAVHPKFGVETDISTRVQVTSPIINKMIEAAELGEIEDGLEVFQELMVEKMRQACLLDDDVWLDVERVGVHPDNREGAGIVPIDVHDLLLRMFQDGFCMNKVDLLA